MIDVLGDHDWYRLSLSAGTTYVFETSQSGSDGLDTLIALRDASGAGLTSNDDGGTGFFSRITYTATASGTYFVDVGTYGDQTVGAFTISAALAPAAPADAVSGDTSTNATIAIGTSTAGTINQAGDHDWYRVSLTAGQSYRLSTVTTGGGGDVDTTLALHGADGLQLVSNDDSSGLYSGLNFTALTSGIYYIDIGASGSKTGAYQVSLAGAPPLPVYSNDQIAKQLATDYWEGASHHFDVAAGGTLSVNITGLTNAGKILAREALAVWTDVSGIRFSEVTSGGQIVFDDAVAGAMTTANYSRGITSSAQINISTAWLQTYGAALNGFSFQTYLHEIGHALGLGHAGDYHDSSDTVGATVFANDTWNASIMSYLDQTQSSYTQALGLTKQFDLTPMVADQIAAASLYGAATTTRTGDTRYGYGNTSGRVEYDATVNPAGGYTIYDNGGTDTLDYSRNSANQLIDLHPEALSNIGGGIGNVVIARGTVIENAVGGAGNDLIRVNSATNVLIGGAGSDTIEGSTAELAGDRITDLAAGDRIRFDDLDRASFTFTRVGSTLSLAGVTIDVGTANPHLVVAAAPGGGADLVAAARMSGLADFDGDGHSDILWRHVAGAVSTWEVAGNDAASQVQQAVFNTSVDPNWKIVETFDFNGDGLSDMLWRHANGTFSIWNAVGSGNFTQGGYTNASVGNDWRIAATGDTNGDGKDDLLWQRTDGALSVWRSTGTGFTASAYTHASPGAGWVVEGLADLNGDGRADIVWRHSGGTVASWMATASGGYTDGGYAAAVPSGWHIDGLGDFDGDGKADLLWRNDDGAVSLWRSNGAGFDQGAYNSYADPSWHIAAVGDFNDDGKADILWRNDNGALSTWQSNGGGFDQGVYNTAVPTGWTIIGHDFPL